jgi:hypothetical protein
MCEEEYLTTALIHLLTTGRTKIESTACIQILCSLFNLMKRSTVQKTKEDVKSLLLYLENFGTSLFVTSSSDRQLD